MAAIPKPRFRPTRTIPAGRTLRRHLPKSGFPDATSIPMASRVRAPSRGWESGGQPQNATPRAPLCVCTDASIELEQSGGGALATA